VVYIIYLVFGVDPCGLPEGVDAVVCDLLLEDEREGLAEVHVEDVEGVVLHHVRVEKRSVCAPERKEYQQRRHFISDQKFS
jgi:hypothetical protein